MKGVLRDVNNLLRIISRVSFEENSLQHANYTEKYNYFSTSFGYICVSILIVKHGWTDTRFLYW